MIAATAVLLLAGVTVTLPEEAKVRGTEMTVGDIAVVTGEDAAEVERVKQLSLGYTPAPGFARTMRSWKLQQELVRALPGTDVRIAGAEATRIWPETARITGAAFEEAAREAARKLMEGREVRITLRSELRDLEVPVGRQGHALLPDARSQRPVLGSWSLPVRVMIDGEQYTTVWAPMTIEAYQVLPIVSRELKVGELITADAITMQRTLVGGSLRGTPMTALPLVGDITNRNLRVGNILMQGDVRHARAVQQGATVQLEIVNGRVVARVLVVASEHGHIGDTIRAKNLSSGKELFCTVIGKDLLRVNLGQGQERRNR